jgi:nicotinate-nucleotide pyrophosphorylase (carboxylating)
LKLEVEWLVDEGQEITVSGRDRVAVARVTGPVRKLLVAERTALNLLSRASGIATLSRLAHNVAKEHKFKGVVAGTRKTTPGFRFVEKFAILVGGCDMHRMDLSSMIMLKVKFSDTIKTKNGIKQTNKIKQNQIKIT